MFLLIPIAFISGVLTVFSPCVLPILPIILASGIDGKIERIRGTIVGLVVSFTLASLFLSLLVKALEISADTIRTIAVFLLVIFGISMIFPRLWEKVQVVIEQHWKVQPVRSQKQNFLGGFLTGVSLGIVWTPCIGPIIATVATLAAVNQFSFTTILVAFSYALGTGVPLYFIAKGGGAVTKKLAFVKTKNENIRQVFGLVILATALFIFFGFDRALQAWTLSHLPTQWTQLASSFENKVNVSGTINELKKNPSGSSTNSNGQRVLLQDDFTGAKVRPGDIQQGCIGQDCIPSLDNPKFESVSAASWLNDEDVVFGVVHKGQRRAYPQRILNWHEVVNDKIVGDPLVVTFCPLCGLAAVFERVVNGKEVQFGVSGKLHNNDLIMYDRTEGNLWQQITGEAIVGPAARRNEKLTQILVTTTTWKQWKTQFPDSKVLSRNTGFSRNYDVYPYGTYERDNEIFFGLDNKDAVLSKSLPIKAVVYGVEINGFSKAYPADLLKKERTINDTVGSTRLLIETSDDGAVKVTNRKENKQVIPLRLFWFAWAAFHPQTELYDGK